MGRYLTHHGRMNRARYILSSLAMSIPVFLFEFLSSSAISNENAEAIPLLVINLIIYAGSTYLSICWSIQRFHDLDKSGIYYLWMLVPLVNIYWCIALLFFKGTDGSNKYGRDPLTSGYATDVYEY